MDKVLCVDIGGSKILYGIFDGNTLLESNKIYFSDVKINSQQELVKYIKNIADRNNIARISFSIAGYIKDSTVVRSPNLKWIEGLNIKENFENYIVSVENDANIFAYAQYIKFQIPTLVGIIWGTGIGGGIIVQGKIVKGENGFCGEIGHMICDYKNAKSYEEVLGTQGIMKTFGENKYPLEIYKHNPKQFENITLQPLSCLIISLYELLDISTFVFGGGIGSNLSQEYYKKLKEEITKKLKYHPYHNLTLIKAQESEKEILMALRRIIDDEH